MSGESNPSLIVTKMPDAAAPSMSSTIVPGAIWRAGSKERRPELLATRTSASWMSSNRLRLLFSASARILASTAQRFPSAGESLHRRSMPSGPEVESDESRLCYGILTSGGYSLIRSESFPYWDIRRRLLMQSKTWSSRHSIGRWLPRSRGTRNSGTASESHHRPSIRRFPLW